MTAIPAAVKATADAIAARVAATVAASVPVFEPAGCSQYAAYLWKTKRPEMNARKRSGFETTIRNGIQFVSTGRQMYKLSREEACGDPTLFRTFNPARIKGEKCHTVQIRLERVPGLSEPIVTALCDCEANEQFGHCLHAERACLLCEHYMERAEAGEFGDGCEIAASNSFATATTTTTAAPSPEPVAWQDRTPVSAATRESDWG